MNQWPKNPIVYEINTWVWLNELSRKARQSVTLGSIPDSELDRLASYGFDALWLMGIWQRSSAARQAALEHPGLRAEYPRILSDFCIEDVVGSPYAIFDYKVDEALGGDGEYAVLHDRLKRIGLRVILDFVPNHFAKDHPWILDHPHRLVRGGQDSVSREPQNYFCVGTGDHAQVFAHGKDPHFDAWNDTVQLDYRHPDTRQAMADILIEVAKRCEGLRCDMAMLVSHDVFLRTWGGQFDPPGVEFWSAAIKDVKEIYPDFLMLAEVYWDMEYHLQQLGFDYVYDKRLYDRLLQDDATSVRNHLSASIDFQRHLARFIENHDERRARDSFGQERGMAAATLALLLPGLRLLYEGQLAGLSLKLPVQLGRRPEEPLNQDLESFYGRLLDALHHQIFHDGDWQLLEPRQTWPGNDSYHNFVVYRWALSGEIRVLSVNLGPGRAQCYAPLDTAALAGCSWQLNDLLSDAHYIREGRELLAPGLYLDMPGYGYHLFEIQPGSKEVPIGVQLRCTIHGSKKGIYGIAWSPDGQMLASSGEERTICLWNPGQCSSLGQLDGHTDVVSSVAWSSDSRKLASGSNDRTVRIWDIDKRALEQTLEGHRDNVLSVAWSPDGWYLASGACDWKTILWDIKKGKPVRVWGKHTDAVNSVAWSPDGKTLASGSGDWSVNLWDVKTGKLKQTINERDWVGCVAWSDDGNLIISGIGNGTIGVWDVETGQQRAILEGHTDRILWVSFICNGLLLVSKSADNSVRFWQPHTWNAVASLEEEYGIYLSGGTGHPREPMLATRDDKENVIRIWDLDVQALISNPPTEPSVRYANAKVVIVGESGTGKTCLARALMGERFEPQPSTHGMKVWTFPSEVTQLPTGEEVIRETLLWDLAGQTEYQLVHQLFLDETALGIVLFDPTHPENPFAGVGHWEKALRKIAGEDCPRLLVAARVDRGYPTATAEDIDTFRFEHGFCDFVATSALIGEGVEELRRAIARSICWETLPVTVSPEMWTVFREYLVNRREGRDVLTRLSDLREVFRADHGEVRLSNAEFETVISQAQAQGLVWRLSFGDFILLKPELLNDYASAVVRVARKHLQGIGSVLENDVLEGRIDFENMERLANEKTEQSLLHAVVELFLKREVALREGQHLVFPSKFNRKRPDFPVLPFSEVAYSFAGPVENIYATLVVRLFYCGAFELKDLWKNAAEFSDSVGRACGFHLVNSEEGRGTISVFFEKAVPTDSRVLFLRFIHEHIEKRALSESLMRERIYRCPNCGEEVENKRPVQVRLKKGLKTIPCQYCSVEIQLIDLLEERFGDPELLQLVRGLEHKAEANKELAVGKVTEKLREEFSEFDVFLAHNSVDKPLVRAVSEALRRRNLRPWFDEDQIPPGSLFQDHILDAIRNSKSAAIFVGSNGLGNWEAMELRLSLSQCIERRIPVIPVLLPGVTEIPSELGFFKELTLVRFSESVNEVEALDRLEWGITGIHPQHKSG